MDVIREIHRLKSIEAVRTLIAKYAQAADAYSAPALMSPLFAQAATWRCERLGAYYRGRDQVTMELAKSRESTVFWTMHFNVSPIVEIFDDGVSGKAFWYLWELARTSLDGRAERDNTLIAGWYNAELIVEDDHWCFNQIELELRLAAPAPGPAWPVD